MDPAPFEVETKELDGGIRAVSVRGELDLNTAPALQEPLEEALAAGDQSLVIDLGDCEFIDSTGIALIIRTWQQLDRDAGGGGTGRLVITCSNAQVLRLLDITGVGASVSLYGSRDEALEALRS